MHTNLLVPPPSSLRIKEPGWWSSYLPEKRPVSWETWMSIWTTFQSLELIISNDIFHSTHAVHPYTYILDHVMSSFISSISKFPILLLIFMFFKVIENFSLLTIYSHLIHHPSFFFFSFMHVRLLLYYSSPVAWSAFLIIFLPIPLKTIFFLF